MKKVGSSGDVGSLKDCKVWAPGHGPRQVFFDVVVRLFYDIDVVKQQFSARVVLNFQWMLSGEEKEIWAKAKSSGDRQPLARLWRPPQVDVANAMDVSVDVSEVTVTKLGSMILGQCSQKLQGTFFEVMELENFPFDCQDFTLRMVFPESSEELEMHTAIDKAECVQMVQDQMLLPEYRFSDPILELGFTKDTQLHSDFTTKEVSYPSIALRIKASRAWRSYVNKVVIVMAMVTLAVSFSFMIDREDIGDRLAHVTTLFLTAVAFQFVVSSSLPQIDYMTLLDKYILAMNMYILVVMGVMTLIEYIGDHDITHEASIAQIDKYSMIGCFFLWALTHVSFGMCAAYVHARIELPKLRLFSGLFQGREAVRGTSSHYYSVVKDGSTDSQIFGSATTCHASARLQKDRTIWSGTWYSEDFYKGQGIEYVSISVLCDKSGQLELMARKITGDDLVPCGLITWQTTRGVPEIGGPEVPCKVQGRRDTNNLQGFKWFTDVTVKAVSINELRFTHGSFHRQDKIHTGDVDAAEGDSRSEPGPEDPFLGRREGEE